MFCDCFFCENKRFSLNRRLGLEAEKSVIYEDENVFVTPDIAPVVKGHFLIVTQKHINSYGNADEKVYASLEKAKQFLICDLYHTDNVLFWEHGAVVSHSAGGCIDHAHIHVVPMPLNLDIDSFLESLDFMISPKQILKYQLLRKTAQSGQPYISYEYGNGESYFRCVNRIPSQFFRLMISKYQLQEYNWKLRFRDEKSKELFRCTLEMAKI